MNEPRKKRERAKAAAMLLAGAVASAAPGIDPIARPPLEETAIRANTERTAEAMAQLPPGDLLLSYQQSTLGEVSANALLVVEKSRRIGLTWGLASDAVLTAGATKEAGGDDVLYISYSQEMTREFVDACAMWAKSFMGLTAETGEFLFDDQVEGSTDTKKIKAFRISFASGFEIVALSSAPRSLRGKQGRVILDEAAFVDNLSELLKAALALQIWGSKIVIVSTHNGVDNPFNLLIEDINAGKRGGKVVRITFADAMAAGLYERVCLVRGITPSAEGKIAWEAEIRGNYGDAAAEELDCIPTSGKGSWIPPELIAACTSPEAGKPELYSGKSSAIGWDIARRAHLSVIAPFEDLGSHLILRKQIELVGVPFSEQDAIFDETMRVFRCGRACIDMTGLGMKVVEDAQGRHGETVVEGIMFSAPVKLMLANLLKKRFEDGTILISDDPAVRADLRSIKKSGAGTGVPVFDSDEPKASQADGADASFKRVGHGDRFWAYALACLAAERGLIAYEGYASALARRPSADTLAGAANSNRMKMQPDHRDDDAMRTTKGTW